MGLLAVRFHQLRLITYKAVSGWCIYERTEFHLGNIVCIFEEKTRMTYFYSHYRKPKQGTLLKVGALAIETRNKMPTPGFVTATISVPQPVVGSNMIVSTTIFESVEEMDKALDYNDTSDEVLGRIQSVDALCESSASVIGKVLHSVTPQGFVPKICVRDTVTAADGKLADLIAFFSEGIEGDWGGVAKGASVSMILGRPNINSIRITAFFQSLADFDKADSAIRSNSPGLQKLLELRAIPQSRAVSRVLSFTPPQA